MITRRQTASTTVTSGTGGLVTLATPPLYRNTLVLIVTQRLSTATVLAGAPTQTGATWVKDGATVTAATISTERWIVERVETGAAAPITLTLNAAGNASITVLEYSGVAVSPLDVEASATGHSNAPFSGQTAATTADTTLWIGGIGHVKGGVAQHTPSNGFTQVTHVASGSSPTDVVLGVYEKIVPAGGALVDVTAQTNFAVRYAGFAATYLQDTSTPQSRAVDVTAAIALGTTIDAFLDLAVVQQVLRTAALNVGIRFDVQTGLNAWIEAAGNVASLLDVLVQPQRRVDLDVATFGTETLQPDVDLFIANRFEASGFLDLLIQGQTLDVINMQVAILEAFTLPNSIATPDGPYLECRPLWCGVPKTHDVTASLNVAITSTSTKSTQLGAAIAAAQLHQGFCDVSIV